METYRSLKDIAKTVRQSLKAEIPGCKFSVVVRHYSSIEVSLMSALGEVTRDGQKYAQLNPYTFTSRYGYGREELESNGCKLTTYGFKVMERATQILAREHWDKSDIQSDYFCCAYYMHVNIGKWDKDYQVKR